MCKKMHYFIDTTLSLKVDGLMEGDLGGGGLWSRKWLEEPDIVLLPKDKIVEDCHWSVSSIISNVQKEGESEEEIKLAAEQIECWWPSFMQPNLSRCQRPP
ncbi:hypothetical protein ACB092_02G021600 [Castanea dentata]